MALVSKPNAQQFRDALRRHGRREVFHWTPMSSLPSVLEHGILCRRDLDARNISYEPHGYGRAGKENDFAGHVCVSFYPHKGMMKSETGALAVIVMSSEVVITEGAFYCPQNTARSAYEFDELVSQSSIEHLEELFEGPDEWRSATTRRKYGFRMASLLPLLVRYGFARRKSSIKHWRFVQISRQ